MKIVHITGAGRSGSTAMSITLGNHPDTVSLGEADNLPIAWNSPQHTCACNRHATTCEFWSEVYHTWIESAGADNCHQYAELQRTFEHIRGIPRLLRERVRPSAHYEVYLRTTLLLYHAIQKVSGREIIIDSSKRPARALVLASLPDSELYVIHLVRDARGVAWSFMRTERKHRGREGRFSHLYYGTAWVFTNLVAQWVCNRLDPQRSVRIRYETFAQEPTPTLEMLGTILHLDLSTIIEKAAQKRPLLSGHEIGGYGIQRDGSIILEYKATWQSEMPQSAQSQTAMIAGWLMRRYGY